MNSRIAIFFLLVFTACTGPKEPDYALPVPLPGLVYPALDGDKQLTDGRVTLGKKLFFDSVLSADGKTSCASCHKPKLAYADSVKTSVAHGAEVRRNTPSVLNVAWYPYFFAEGGVLSLEQASAVPVQSEHEMGLNLGDAVQRLSASSEYVLLFKNSYGQEPSVYTLVRALSAFQRSLVSAGSPFDDYVRGNKNALSGLQKQGMALFYSDSLGCAKCHSGSLFTDFGFYSVGNFSAADLGRYRLTGILSDSGKFKTPSLRNIALTAPYMHDGSLLNLETVLHFYEKGGGNHTKSKLLKPFALSDTDRRALIAFLGGLTDSVFTRNPNFVPLK